MVEIQENNKTEESVDIKDISVESSKLDKLNNLSDLSEYESKIQLPKSTFSTMIDEVPRIDKKQLNLQKTKESVEIK